MTLTYRGLKDPNFESLSLVQLSELYEHSISEPSELYEWLRRHVIPSMCSHVIA